MFIVAVIHTCIDPIKLNGGTAYGAIKRILMEVGGAARVRIRQNV